MKNWTPQSWRLKPIDQLPDYPDFNKLHMIEKQIHRYPNLIFSEEVRLLKKKLSDVTDGNSFLLQAGDCAESFLEYDAKTICDFFYIFLQMSTILASGILKPIVKIGRIAGQFAKPRSEEIESQNGIKLPVYRGDIVNGINFNKESRIPDPRRMMMVYHQSAATLNLLRGFSQNDYANIKNIHTWIVNFLKNSSQYDRNKEFLNYLKETISFMQSIEIFDKKNLFIKNPLLFTSHESLLLYYEEAMTRIDSKTGLWYNTSGHMLWIGDRTRKETHAHIEYCRGLDNPIGLKCGPSINSNELLRLIDILNPKNEKGKLILITRFGSKNIQRCFPDLIRTVKKEGREVIWSCDPMHGNTIIMNGYKTRSFCFILKEIEDFFYILQSEKIFPGGIHIEMTPKNVTECIGGSCKISSDDLPNRYCTHCDPRLNADQALELIFFISDLLKKTRLSSF